MRFSKGAMTVEVEYGSNLMIERGADNYGPRQEIGIEKADIDDALAVMATVLTWRTGGDVDAAAEMHGVTVTRDHCSDCGAEILGYHACQGVPGGFGND
jgi:hypothetical protein